MKKYNEAQERAAGRTTYGEAPEETRRVIDSLNCSHSMHRGRRLLDRTQTKKKYITVQGIASLLGIEYEPCNRDAVQESPNTPVLTEVHVLFDGLTAYIAETGGPYKALESIQQAAGLGPNTASEATQFHESLQR